MRAARACGVGVCDAMWRWVPAAHGVQIFEKHDVNHDGELNFVGTCRALPACAACMRMPMPRYVADTTVADVRLCGCVRVAREQST